MNLVTFVGTINACRQFYPFCIPLFGLFLLKIIDFRSCDAKLESKIVVYVFLNMVEFVCYPPERSSPSN